MIRIKPIPVGYPAQEANGISIRVMPFQTSAVDCSTYYQLVNITVVINEEEQETETIKNLADGNSPITPEQYADWGSDNEYIENIVLENLGLERE
jgi:hypothetical protein